MSKHQNRDYCLDKSLLVCLLHAIVNGNVCLVRIPHSSSDIISNSSRHGCTAVTAVSLFGRAIKVATPLTAEILEVWLPYNNDIM